MNYYISDLHMGHENVIKHDNRPFSSLEEMHCVLINNWNSVVTPKDDVYVLGDMFWKPEYALKIMPKLKGKIHLIKGNHDSLRSDIVDLYTEVADYKEIKDNGNRVILFHFPIAHWNAQYHGSIHLYGHIHATRDTRPFEQYKTYCEEMEIPFRCANVGCMLPYMGYVPRTLNYLMDCLHI